ncbi:MAG: cold-shock protein [Deltaproteobacteria bacterium]
MSGKIKKLNRERGFGFISNTEGKDFFFHRSQVSGIDFDSLTENQTVEFDVENSPKGPRAVNVKLAAE